jgi:flagellar assembly factor FliW
VIDPGDETILLWLQSIENPALCFPVIEPKLIDPHYAIKLSETEKESLGIENLSQTMIFSILTIPENLTLSTANLRAPLVIHLVTHEARQIILQDVNRDIRHPAYKALRTCVDLYGSEDLRKTAAKALPIKETKNFRAFSESLSL